MFRGGSTSKLPLPSAVGVLKPNTTFVNNEIAIHHENLSDEYTSMKTQTSERTENGVKTKVVTTIMSKPDGTTKTITETTVTKPDGSSSTSRSEKTENIPAGSGGGAALRSTPSAPAP